MVTRIDDRFAFLGVGAPLGRYGTFVGRPDADSEPSYLEARHLLSHDLALSAVATVDDCVGSIAAWTAESERLLELRGSSAPGRRASTLRAEDARP
jgi:hypothetical protein